LSAFLGCAKAFSKDGAIIFVFMDWRHLTELTGAGRENELDLKNLVVWLLRRHCSALAEIHR
jgi:hypothetical protein